MKQTLPPVVSVMSALAGMGSSLAASVSDCSSVNGGGSDQADCASAVLALVQGLNDVAAAGKALKAGCSAGAARLYVEESPPSLIVCSLGPWSGYSHRPGHSYSLSKAMVLG